MFVRQAIALKYMLKFELIKKLDESYYDFNDAESLFKQHKKSYESGSSGLDSFHCDW